MVKCPECGAELEADWEDDSEGTPYVAGLICTNCWWTSYD